VSGGTEPLILNFCTRWTESLQSLADRHASGEIASMCIGYWLGGPASGLDTLGNGKPLASAWNRKATPLLSNLVTMPTFFLRTLLILFVSLNLSLLLHVTYDPYYCPYTTNAKQTSMPPAGFKPTIPASERP
jgi:hypothetical protein